MSTTSVEPGTGSARWAITSIVPNEASAASTYCESVSGSDSRALNRSDAEPKSASRLGATLNATHAPNTATATATVSNTITSNC